MAFIEPMHRNKPNITYLLTDCERPALQRIIIIQQKPRMVLYYTIQIMRLVNINPDYIESHVDHTTVFLVISAKF